MGETDLSFFFFLPVLQQVQTINNCIGIVWWHQEVINSSWSRVQDKNLSLVSPVFSFYFIMQIQNHSLNN